MHFYFVIPLIAALISAYAQHKSDEEISYLTGSVTVISLVLSLVLAPWELQAGILVIAVVLVRNLWNKIEQQRELIEDITTLQKEDSAANLSAPLTANVPENKPERKYRGVAWEKERNGDSAANFPASVITNVTENKTDKKYRGVTLKEEDLKPRQKSQQKQQLKYRGASHIQKESDRD